MIPALRSLADLPVQAWANGGGSTRVLASDQPDEWKWRVSVATLDQGARFSALPSTRRQFAALDQPVSLIFDQGTVALRRFQVHAFDGAEAPTCALPEGSTRAINLMLRGDAHAALITRPLVGSMLLPPGHAWLLLMLAGHATVSMDNTSMQLAGGQFVELPTGRALLDGGGEIALVRFD
jgi:environmental stress-induced protein Ves